MLEKRKKTEDLIVEYMEREVGVKLTELNTLLVLQNGRFRDEHAVSFIIYKLLQSMNQCLIDRASWFLCLKHWYIFSRPTVGFITCLLYRSKN